MLRQPPAAGESLAFGRHDPQLAVRRVDLAGFGRTKPSELHTLIGPSIHMARNAAQLTDAPGPGTARVLGGRDVRRDGSIGDRNETSRWARCPADRQLRAEDVVVRALQIPTDSNLVVAEVTEADLPLVASQVVLALRPVEGTRHEDRRFGLTYFRSGRALSLLSAVLGGRRAVTPILISSQLGSQNLSQRRGVSRLRVSWLINEAHRRGSVETCLGKITGQAGGRNAQCSSGGGQTP